MRSNQGSPADLRSCETRFRINEGQLVIRNAYSGDPTAASAWNDLALLRLTFT
jgi:hypothetical protein